MKKLTLCFVLIVFIIKSNESKETTIANNIKMDYCDKAKFSNYICMGKFKYQCNSTSICTSNQTKCDVLNTIQDKKKLEIKKCEFDLSNEFCLVQTDCSNDSVNTTKSPKNNKKEKFECACEGKYPFKCDDKIKSKSYCGADFASCVMIPHLKDVKKIKNCPKGNSSSKGFFDKQALKLKFKKN